MQQHKMGENRSSVTLEATDWHLLQNPSQAQVADAATADEKTVEEEVGIVEIHPNNSKLVYATRRRRRKQSSSSDDRHHQRSRSDLGKELIVVQNLNNSSDNNNNNNNNNNKMISCSFTLRELTKAINQYRTNDTYYLSSTSMEQHDVEEILQRGHMEVVTSLSTPLLNVHMLGSVQYIVFMDREALRYCLAPTLIPPDYDVGYDDEYLDGVKHDKKKKNGNTNTTERLLIGFRRCIVVVSISTCCSTNSSSSSINNGNINHNTHHLQVEGFIGPENIDDYENDIIKIQKRQPSSYAIPISENLLAYGCYDGGIRFYNILQHQQAKACLGPNGRTNPIVKMVNANPQQSHFSSRPRLISACVSGTAYLWELDISIDLSSGEINHFDIQPPLACFDGMVAAVSARGVPVTFPPPLSPSSRANLSPCSSWEQTDLLHEQFSISYDAHHDNLCFVFSPDCIGTSLNPHSTRQERLDGNGVLAFWNLSNLPGNEWPPPSLAPLCVTSLPRTKNGKVTSDMVLPGYYYCNNDGFSSSSSLLITLYATTANEIAAAITCLDDHDDNADCVQMGVSAEFLVDLSTLQLGDDNNDDDDDLGNNSSSSGFECHSLTFSSSDPTIVAIGTQYGTLLGRISEDLNATMSSWVTDASTTEYDNDDTGSDVPDEQVEPLKQLDENDRVGNSANDLMSLMNVSNEDNSSDLAEDDIDASQRTSSVGKVEARTEVEELKEEINHYVDLLEEERGRNRELAFELAATKVELAAAEKKGESQFRNSGGESQFRNSGSQSNIDDSMREPRALLSGIDDSMRGAGINEFKRRLSDVQSLEESDISTNNDEDDDLSALTGEYVQTLQEENEELRREVDELKANKDDVSDMSNDGDFFKQVEREKLQKQLSMAKEKVSSLQDYVELLEQNRDAVEVELENARQEAEKNAELVEKLQTDVYEQKLALTEMANLLEEQEKDHADVIVRLKNDPLVSEQDSDPTAKDEAIAKLEVENAQLREEADNQVALVTAMKVELQNALNELAELKR